MSKKTSFVVVAIIALFSLAGLVFAHGGHGDEEAEKLGGSGEIGTIITNPTLVDLENAPLTSFSGIVISDDYGSIFAPREGMVSELKVKLGDPVRRGQVVATITNNTANSPELINIIAERKSAIVISESQKIAAQKVLDYLNNQIQDPGNALSSAYDQKRYVIELSADNKKQQLQTQIESLQSQLDAKETLIAAKKGYSQATIDLASQKTITVQKELVGAIDKNISIIAGIFFDGNISLISYNPIPRAHYWGALDLGALHDFSTQVTVVINKYPIPADVGIEALIELAKEVEVLNQKALGLLNVSIPSGEYTTIKLTADKQKIIDNQSGESGVAVLLSKIQESTKEGGGISATAQADIAQIVADMNDLNAQITILQRELPLIDSEVKKDLADIKGDQAIQGLGIQQDIQKMVNEAQREFITAESSVTGNQRALREVVGAIPQKISVLAPFTGIISRKNVTIGQSVSQSVPIYDIVGGKSSKAFIRFDVPVAQYKLLTLERKIALALPGDTEQVSAFIKRISGSVNQENQTILVEAEFENASPFPLGTQVRIVLEGSVSVSSVSIPEKAYLTENNKTYVWKVLPGNILKKWEINIGETLPPDETIVLSGITVESIIISDVTSQDWKDGQDISSFLTN